MPSSHLRDDLPAHYNRVAELRRVAAAVIRNMGRVRHTSVAPRTTPMATTVKPTAMSQTPQSTGLPSEPLQFEGSVGISAAALRQLLRDHHEDL
jgi:hypothetical protein